MGRKYTGQKQEADSLMRLEIWWLAKKGYTGKYRSGTIEWRHSDDTKSVITIQSNKPDEHLPFIQLTYTQTDEDTLEESYLDYKIPLVTTPCYFGGVRYWFKCPLYVNGKYCGKRAGIIYKGGKYFACRHCQGLTYSIKNLRKKYLHGYYRVIETEWKIEELESKLKRHRYKGKPTRKYRRILNLERKIAQSPN